MESHEERASTPSRPRPCPSSSISRHKGKCVEIDTSQDRETVYGLLCDQLAAYTDPALMARPLSEQAEILLGRKPYPRSA
ncbi:MAG: hypothetical protein U5R48_14070 [Gammaproteobacteria bacterium]|nr:hypothetical protein [Gammaproteobacteria bacterium]